MPDLYQILIRLTLSAILGGLIGMERESVNRPAGFRTHILVCVGSSLIMLSGIYIFYSFYTFTDLDPARLSAQVVSGIGFLGAGTIIKEGATVRGLTTAASLWAVSGIGIAIGSGFYSGAISATLLVLVTLIVFSKLERFLAHKHNEAVIVINTTNRPGQIGMIGTELGRMNVSIINIKMSQDDDRNINIRLNLIVPRNLPVSKIVEKISTLDGINGVESIQ